MDTLSPATSPSHKTAIAKVLGFILTLPAKSDAFIYSTTTNQCTIVSSGLDLDNDKLQAAIRCLMPQPTPQQMSMSRIVCFACGASPLGRDVKLSVCGGCGYVAYCSPACQKLDWGAEHFRECKRTSPGMHPGAAVESRPPNQLAVTRAMTEALKPASIKMMVAEEKPDRPGVERICCLHRSGQPLPIHMGWNTSPDWGTTAPG